MRALGFGILLLAGAASPGVCDSYNELNIGIAATNARDWDRAITYLDKALAAADLNADLTCVAHWDLGEAKLAKDDVSGAIADFTVCIEARPDDMSLLLQRAVAYNLAGKPEAALRDTDTLLAADAENAPAQLARARAYEIQGDAQNQLKVLHAAVTKYPNDNNFALGMGIAELALGRDEAIDTFSKMVDDRRGGLIQNRYAYSWLWLAMANFKLHKEKSESVSLAADLEQWPGPLIQYFRGRVTEEAVYKAAQQGDELVNKGQVCEANFYLGQWRRLHGDDDGAKILLRKAAQDCPKGFVEWYVVQAEFKNAP